MDEASRAKRTAALEEKKRRLEEIKNRRAAASSRLSSAGARSSVGRGTPSQAATTTSTGTSTTTTATTTTASSSSGKSPDLDDYIDDLLNKPAPIVQGPPDPVVTEASLQQQQQPPPTVVPATPAVVPQQQQQEQAPPPPPPKKEVETFTSGTQTIEDDFPPVEAVEEEAGEENKKDEQEDGAAQEAPEETREKTLPEMSAEEKENTLSSEDFSMFFVNASKKVERLLGAPVLADLLIDADYKNERRESMGHVMDNNNKNNKESFVAGRASFECARWTQNRDVTDMDWSPVHKELVLASYHMPNYSKTGSTNPQQQQRHATGPSPASPNKSSSATSGTSTNSNDHHHPHLVSPSRHLLSNNNATLVPKPGENQADGLALVWSLAMPDRPEHIFTCNSPILCSKFHPTEHHLIVGGTYSGQLAVWDLRVGRLPVQRSTLSTVANKCQGHTHPVCTLDLADMGSGIVTASTDGKVNFWALANLRDPAESLVVPNTNISSLAVAPETNTILVGDERGTLSAIYPPNAQSTTGRSTSRRVVKKLNKDSDNHHFGMITAVSTKPPAKTARSVVRRGFLGGSPGLVLTCGVDWTTKLWAPAHSDEPVLSFLSHSYDYMADVQWSPTHPTLFATASSRGTMSLWDLADDLDEPLTKSDGLDVGEGTTGLNRLRWSADGRRIAVASSDRLVVMSMTDEVSKPKADDETKMMNHLTSRGFLEED